MIYFIVISKSFMTFILFIFCFLFIFATENMLHRLLTALIFPPFEHLFLYIREVSTKYAWKCVIPKKISCEFTGHVAIGNP